MLKKDLYAVAGVVYYIYEKCHEMLKKKLPRNLSLCCSLLLVVIAKQLWLYTWGNKRFCQSLCEVLRRFSGKELQIQH